MTLRDTGGFGPLSRGPGGLQWRGALGGRILLASAALAVAWALGACGCAGSHLGAVERATSLAREHREADALTILREQLRAHPDDLASRRLLVRVLALTGDLGGAGREVSVLVQLMGDRDPIPWLELGHADESRHEYEKALEMYDRAAEVAKADPRGPREGGMRAARWGEVGWSRPRLEEAVKRGARQRHLARARPRPLARRGSRRGVRRSTAPDFWQTHWRSNVTSASPPSR